EAQIAQALTGSYREEHLFELKLAHEAWQFSLAQVEKVDAQIALQLGRMKSGRALPPLKPKPRPKRRVNSPGFDVRTALYYVVGLGSADSAQTRVQAGRHAVASRGRVERPCHPEHPPERANLRSWGNSNNRPRPTTGRRPAPKRWLRRHIARSNQ